MKAWNNAIDFIFFPNANKIKLEQQRIVANIRKFLNIKKVNYVMHKYKFETVNTNNTKIVGP